MSLATGRFVFRYESLSKENVHREHQESFDALQVA
jgi:hypothetical protein